MVMMEKPLWYRHSSSAAGGPVWSGCGFICVGRRSCARQLHLGARELGPRRDITTAGGSLLGCPSTPAPGANCWPAFTLAGGPFFFFFLKTRRNFSSLNTFIKPVGPYFSALSHLYVLGGLTVNYTRKGRELPCVWPAWFMCLKGRVLHTAQTGPLLRQVARL